jgi:hypothetical protein
MMARCDISKFSHLGTKENRIGNAIMQNERQTRRHSGREDLGTWERISWSSSGGRLSIMSDAQQRAFAMGEIHSGM